MALSGKVAIVTGASRGIGEAIAATLARRGADLALVARNNGELEAVARRIAGASPQRILPFACDLRRRDEIPKLIDEIIAAFGRIDILVNNAGATKHGNLLERDDEDWLDAYDAKIHAFVRMCRACWPHLKASRGHIVNIGGVLAHTPNPNALIGSTLAAGVVSLTKALAEFGRLDGITVNGINPGLIETGRFRQRLEELAQAEKIALGEERTRMVSRLGIDRLGRAQDVADVVDFLLTDQATYLRGAIIDVDGGMTKSI